MRIKPVLDIGDNSCHDTVVHDVTHGVALLDALIEDTVATRIMQGEPPMRVQRANQSHKRGRDT